MRKIVLLFLFISSLVQGQELTNFYLEPGTTNNEVTLHTSFFYHSSAILHSTEIDIVGNTINFLICYNLGFVPVESYDHQEFIINLPSGNTNFVLNISLYVFNDSWGICDLQNVYDSGTIQFDYPYLPIAKTFVPDNNFETYIEEEGLGDDVMDNDYIYTHRFENLGRLNIDAEEIEDLTGIEILYRLGVFSFILNLVTEFNAANHPELWKIWAYGNPLVSLDFSQNPLLRDVLLTENNLTYLNLRNGNNENFDFLVLNESPNLTCISVDDPSLAPYPNWSVGVPNVIYKDDCLLGIDETEGIQVVIYPNPVQEVLTIESREVIDDVSVYSMLGELISSEKNTNQIDFSNYTNGVYFVKVEIEKGSIFQKVLKE